MADQMCVCGRWKLPASAALGVTPRDDRERTDRTQDTLRSYEMFIQVECPECGVANASPTLNSFKITPTGEIKDEVHDLESKIERLQAQVQEMLAGKAGASKEEPTG